MEAKISAPWRELLAAEFEAPYFAQLSQFIRSEYKVGDVCPRPEDIFRAFDLCLPQDVKVVIIGQDPYHGEGQAHGLSFSVPAGVATPPSLQNIFKEIGADLGKVAPQSGNLDRWANQGVLLLNSVLTVRAHQPASHAARGWERFTDAVVERLSAQQDGVVYMLWGAYAQKKGEKISDPARNSILTSSHPSPLSAYRGFLGCGHFSAANNYLQRLGKPQIEW